MPKIIIIYMFFLQTAQSNTKCPQFIGPPPFVDVFSRFRRSLTDKPVALVYSAVKHLLNWHKNLSILSETGNTVMNFSYSKRCVYSFIWLNRLVIFTIPQYSFWIALNIFIVSIQETFRDWPTTVTEQTFPSFVYIFCIAVNLDCWTETKNVHGPSGTPRSFTTLEECQAACINSSTCVAIDWEPSNAGNTCWILTSTLIKDTTRTGVITHYELRRPCPSKCHCYCTLYRQVI